MGRGKPSLVCRLTLEAESGRTSLRHDNGFTGGRVATAFASPKGQLRLDPPKQRSRDDHPCDKTRSFSGRWHGMGLEFSHMGDPKHESTGDPAPIASEEAKHEEIAEVASHVYEVRGGVGGNDVEDWLKAEAILERREHAAATEQPLVDHTKAAVAPKQSD